MATALIALGLGCRTAPEEDQLRRILADLRESFPIKIGQSIEVVPDYLEQTNEIRYFIARLPTDQGQTLNCFDYLMVGDLNGKVRVYVSDSKVVRVDVSLGHSESGEFSKFMRIY